MYNNVIKKHRNKYPAKTKQIRLFVIYKLLIVALTVSSTILVGTAELGCAHYSSANKKISTATTNKQNNPNLEKNTVLAFIGDKDISADLIPPQTQGAIFRLKHQEYDILSNSFNQILNEQLLLLESERLKTTPELLFQEKALLKTTEVTDEMAVLYYESHKGEYATISKQQALYDIKLKLRTSNAENNFKEYLNNLKKQYNVKKLFSPPRANVSLDDDPNIGNKDAPISIVEFSDFSCSYCTKAHRIVESIIKKYPEKVKLVYRDFPLNTHKTSVMKSEAAECAKDQNKYWEMVELFLKDETNESIDRINISQHAEDLGMDLFSFESCMESRKYQNEIKKDFEDGLKYGVTGIPTFYINGILLEGLTSESTFLEIIENELLSKNN